MGGVPATADTDPVPLTTTSRFGFPSAVVSYA